MKKNEVNYKKLKFKIELKFFKKLLLPSKLHNYDKKNHVTFCITYKYYTV